MIQAYQSGKTQEATQLHLKLLPLFKALFTTTNPIPLKCALNLQGWDVGSTRPPLCEASEEVKQALEVVMQQLNLL
jgi:4-hydroxy-tetrahydrodipicolinate synthase